MKLKKKHKHLFRSHVGRLMAAEARLHQQKGGNGRRFGNNWFPTTTAQ